MNYLLISNSDADTEIIIYIEMLHTGEKMLVQNDIFFKEIKNCQASRLLNYPVKRGSRANNWLSKTCAKNPAFVQK